MLWQHHNPGLPTPTSKRRSAPHITSASAERELTMETQEKRDNQLELRPVDDTEQACITGGVGPVFDVSKVEGPKLPSWYLPLNPRLSITTIR